MVWRHYLPKKSLLVVVSGRPNLVLSPGPGLWSLDLLDLTWDLDLALSLTIMDKS